MVIIILIFSSFSYEGGEFSREAIREILGLGVRVTGMSQSIHNLWVVRFVCCKVDSLIEL